MKKNLYLSLATALALTSCSNDEFLGTSPVDVQTPPQEDAEVAIAFGGEALRPTRANTKEGIDAAKALNNNFIVYGFKTTAAEAVAGTNDKPVFDLFNVNYEEGTANTTESNSANWEYVGLANHDGSINPQAIKYWDLSANSYVFSAVSGTGIKAAKILDGTTSKYQKGWNIEVPAGGSLSDLYASDRLVATKDGAGVKGKYQDVITLTFRALGTKIRFAMYEVVPGYDVHIDRVFYVDENDDKKFSDTNFYIKGNFKTANAGAVTPLTVTYYDDDEPSVENRPKVTYDQSQVTCLPYGQFGSNLQTAEKLGESSVDATYDQKDKSYTMVLPYESKQVETDPAKQENILKLKVNFTLTSTDKSKEEIKVYGATAYVPTQYTQWKPNFAYTYIFKISDNVNGTTVTPVDPDDPDDPGYLDPDDPGYDPDDPNIGLYPITFDAVVITDEEDVQETITTVAEPSITTYAKGIVVTENDEYTADTDVYVTVMKDGALQGDLATSARVFEVYNYGKIEGISEEVVDNYLNNYCVLIPVNPAPETNVTAVPLTDGTNLTFAAGEVLKFKTAAGKVYAVQYAYTDAASNIKYVYKVIKVAGPKNDADYTFSVKSGSPIVKMDGKAVLQLKQDTDPVLGAVPSFEVSKSGLVIKPSATEGEYVVSLDAKAVAAGTVNGTYTINFNDKSVDVVVDLAYSLTTALTVEAGDATGANASLTIGGDAADGVVTDVPAGITVDKTATGTYKVTAASDMAAGVYTVKIAGQPLAITVQNYSFNPTAVTMTKPYNDNAYANINLWDAFAGAAPVVEASAITGATTGLSIANVNATADGTYTLTGSAGGVYTLTYHKTAAKCVVTVNEYSIATPEPPIKSTGKTNITVKCNGQAINASTANLVETAKPTGAVYTVTANGKNITFSNASKSGDYKFDYKVAGVIVAQVTVTVID